MENEHSGYSARNCVPSVRLGNSSCGCVIGIPFRHRSARQNFPRERERERDSESASTCGSQVPNWRACCATPGVPLRKSRMPYKPPPRIGGANALGRAGLFTRFSHSALPTAQSVTQWAEARLILHLRQSCGHTQHERFVCLTWSPHSTLIHTCSRANLRVSRSPHPPTRQVPKWMEQQFLTPTVNTTRSSLTALEKTASSFNRHGRWRQVGGLAFYVM